MQVFFWSSGVTVALFFAVWTIVPLLFGWISLLLPDRWFAPELPFWRAHRWEQGGRFYERVFHIKSWKRLLPDGGALFRIVLPLRRGRPTDAEAHHFREGS